MTPDQHELIELARAIVAMTEGKRRTISVLPGDVTELLDTAALLVKRVDTASGKRPKLQIVQHD